MTYNDLIVVARSWIDTKYHHQGRLKGVGVDCIGLILGIGEELGIKGFDRPEFIAYGRRPPKGRNMLYYFDQMLVPRIGDIRPSDILVFWINEKTKRPQHVGLLTVHPLGYHGVLHTYSNIGKVVEQAYEPTWSPRLVKAYRFPGVNE